MQKNSATIFWQDYCANDEKKSHFLLVFPKKPYICTEITNEFKTKTDAIERSIPFINKHLS